MNWSQIFELIGKLATGIAALAGAWWAVVRWRKQDELFPRVNFEVSANFVGFHGDSVITELVAVLENKGQVPLKIRPFSFKVRGLGKEATLQKGSANVRGQLLFPTLLEEGDFVPASWDHSFVYPGVRTEYNFVIAIPKTVAFIRMQGDFQYLGRQDATHHAAKILAVPTNEALPTLATGDPMPAAKADGEGTAQQAPAPDGARSLALLGTAPRG
ncbi:hypothetical protein WME79_31900 [Sorangium sp. So ce726]|uniref:hypothetical protein n=1 Tax=Sorangium sp. So ce726 TaxID=3133319 RepID=UPI003F6457C4